MSKIKIVKITDLYLSDYNPRKRVTERFNLLKLSLQKLGFLSPIVRAKDGEILSGHQRFSAAQELNFKTVPVLEVDCPDLDKRKTLNILLNRSTNDMNNFSKPKELFKELDQNNINKISSLVVDNDDPARCANTKIVETGLLYNINKDRFIDYARNVAASLYFHGISLPIVCKEDLTIVNGIGRLQVALEKKEQTVDVIFVTELEAELADLLLNMLSMDFYIDENYADQLRYGSYRRPLTTRPGLGKGFYIHKFGDISTKNFDFTKNADKWVAKYGRNVVDFGAGKFTDTNILRGMGVNVSPFEPFPITGSNVDLDKARMVTMAFLDDVASCKNFDSVFISSVLNSIPFRSDRENVATVLSGLVGKKSTCYAWTMADNHANYQVIKRSYKNRKCSKLIQFEMDYEPGILLGDISKNPKIQKFHSGKELYDVFKLSFNNVGVKLIGANLALMANNPKIDVSRIRTAIEFEFNLPYKCGNRLDMVDEAKNAFSKRLGVKI